MSFDHNSITASFTADVLFPADLSDAPIRRTLTEPDSARVSRCDSQADAVVVRVDSTQCAPFWAEAVVSRANVRAATGGTSAIVRITCRGGRLSVRPNRVQAHLTSTGVVYFSEKPMPGFPFIEGDFVCYARVQLPQCVLADWSVTVADTHNGKCLVPRKVNTEK